MKRLVAIMLVVIALAGCALFERSSRPAASAADLVICDQTAKTPLEWEECCREVARRYPLTDGGPRDITQCELGLDGGM